MPTDFERVKRFGPGVANMSVNVVSQTTGQPLGVRSYVVAAQKKDEEGT